MLDSQVSESLAEDLLQPSPKFNDGILVINEVIMKKIQRNCRTECQRLRQKFTEEITKFESIIDQEIEYSNAQYEILDSNVDVIEKLYEIKADTNQEIQNLTDVFKVKFLTEMDGIEESIAPGTYHTCKEMITNTGTFGPSWFQSLNATFFSNNRREKRDDEFDEPHENVETWGNFLGAISDSVLEFDQTRDGYKAKAQRRAEAAINARFEKNAKKLYDIDDMAPGLKKDHLQKLYYNERDTLRKMKNQVKGAYDFDPLWNTANHDVLANTKTELRIHRDKMRQARKGNKYSKIKSYCSEMKHGIKGMSKTEGLSKAVGVVSSIVTASAKFKEGDALNVVSGCLDIVDSISTFMPPPASVVTESLSGIVGMFLPAQPSREEQLINDLKNTMVNEFNSLNIKLDENFESLNNKLDTNFGNLNDKLDTSFKNLNNKLDAGFNELTTTIKEGITNLTEKMDFGFSKQQTYLRNEFNGTRNFISQKFEVLIGEIEHLLEWQTLKEKGITIKTLADKISRLEMNIEGFKVSVMEIVLIDLFGEFDNIKHSIQDYCIGNLELYPRNKKVRSICLSMFHAYVTLDFQVDTIVGKVITFLTNDGSYATKSSILWNMQKDRLVKKKTWIKKFFENEDNLPTSCALLKNVDIWSNQKEYEEVERYVKVLGFDSQSFGKKCPSSKIFVVGGETSKLIDLANPNRVCYDLPVFPFNFYGGIGIFTSLGPVLCSHLGCHNFGSYKGDDGDGEYARLYYITTADTKLLIKRKYFTVIEREEDNFICIGGSGDNSIEALNVTRGEVNLVNLTVHDNGVTSTSSPFEMPFGPCAMKVNDTHYIITGGGGQFVETFFIDLKTLEFLPGPNLQEKRAGHACISFYVGGKMYGMVSGGYSDGRRSQSTEIISFDHTTLTWKIGNNFILCIVFFFFLFIFKLYLNTSSSNLNSVSISSSAFEHKPGGPGDH